MGVRGLSRRSGAGRLGYRTLRTVAHSTRRLDVVHCVHMAHGSWLRYGKGPGLAEGAFAGAVASDVGGGMAHLDPSITHAPRVASGVDAIVRSDPRGPV